MIVRAFLAGAISCALWCGSATAVCAQSDFDFDRDIRPILAKHCGACHGEAKQQGGLRFDAREGPLRTGDSGERAIVPGDAAGSELIRRVTSEDEATRMPLDAPPLPPEAIELLRHWIDAGAEWPQDASAADAPHRELAVTSDDRRHWSFLPLRSAELPTVYDAAWARTPIDRFILAALESADLSPNADASARVLVRRLCFDLLGLPPTPAEADQFVAAASADPQAALAELVDRLLASRHYGERWGRHWLDVARYADSDGHEGDADRPFAYPYRDFVIQAHNDDLPFDTFVRWQLAGDEIAPDNPRAVAATGFLTAGASTVLDVPMEEEKLRNRYNELDDMLSTIGSGMLGLTLACARCHDHKYDPIPARDYYRLLSALHSGDRQVVSLPGAGGEGEAQQALAFRDFGGERRESWLFGRGDFYDRDEPVELGFLSVLTGDKDAQAYWNEALVERPLAESTYQRKALAAWITDVEGGAGALLARVIVNRIWQHHFGEGLVRTPNDFGRRGEAPSHPELLEWLADDFVAHGWRLKRLHRTILLSAAYAQAGAYSDDKAAVDPTNRLLWRQSPRRLEAEALRDALLAVSGELNPEAFGPAYKPAITAEAFVARNVKDPYPADVEEDAATLRRSVYMFHKRVVPFPLLQVFDRPDLAQSCGRRDATIVAPQALALLNDTFVRARAVAFAARIVANDGAAEALSDDHTARCEAWIDQAYRLALVRDPSASERTAAISFLLARIARRQERQPDQPPDEAARLALADFCQTLFCLNEFLYVD